MSIKKGTQDAQAVKNVAGSHGFRFIQPDPGKLLCPIEDCDHRYKEAKNLYKHCRQRSDHSHKKFAENFSRRRCDICHKDFKRLYDWKRHMEKTHKSSTPTFDGLTPSESTPKLAGLQLRQRNVGVNRAIPDLRLSTEQANPYQPCRSGTGRLTPLAEVSAHPGHTEVPQTGRRFSTPFPPVHESVQGMSESSANWHNTVMNPRNNHEYCCNHQPFLSKERGPAHMLSLENKDFSTVSLPFLLYSLGYSEVRQDVLYRGLLPQKRWNDQGNVQQITLRDAGFDEQIARLFSSKIRLAQAIESCIQLDLIVLGVLVDGSLAYSLSDQARHQICESFNHEELSLLGLIFTAYIYPRDQTLESSFHDLGKLLLPYLQRTWECVQREPRATLPAHARNSLAEACLAACSLVSVSRTNDVTAMLARVQNIGLPDHLRMAIANRQSVSLRLKGHHDQSEIMLQEILEGLAINPADIRSHCARGRLLLSRTENAILRKEFNKAASYLATWEVKNSPASGLELQVVRMKNTAIGRVSRYDGHFEHARYCLEECLKTVLHDASRYHVMHHLADVYCELKIPGEAENLVLGEVKQLRALGKQRSKPYRRLALPLAEAYIEKGTPEAARSVFRDLLDIFDGMAGHDIADQLGHVRAMIGLARVCWSESRWSEARQILERALGLTGKYRAFSKRNFYIGCIYLFLSVVYIKLSQDQEARMTFVSANDILREQVPRHFMPGMGTYFLERLMLSAQSLERLLAN